MDIPIKLQSATRALPGTIEAYWFENSFVQLPLTLFHRIYIPLAPFSPQLGYGPDVVETEIVIEWLDLNLSQPGQLDGLRLSHHTHPKAECSVYVGDAHNWCDIRSLALTELTKHRYQLRGDLWVHFEYEGVAPGESFAFATDLMHRGVL